MDRKLDETRLIDLSALVDFYGDDLHFLESLREEAGIGRNGQYETFRLGMAMYNLRAAKDYLEWIVNDSLGLSALKEPKMTFITERGEVIGSSKDENQLVLKPTLKEKSPWVPPFKDEDKIGQVIIEILNDTSAKDRKVPGFRGWLAASATAALDGKPDVKIVLKKIDEVLGV